MSLKEGAAYSMPDEGKWKWEEWDGEIKRKRENEKEKSAKRMNDEDDKLGEKVWIKRNRLREK